MLQTTKCFLQILVSFYNVHDMVVVWNKCHCSNIRCHFQLQWSIEN